VKLVLIGLLGLWVSAQIPLPPGTSEVKVLHERIVSLEAAEKGGWLVVRDMSGRLLRKVQAGAGIEGIRAAEIKDFTLDEGRTLIVSLGASFPLGRTARILASYPEQGEPRFVTLEDLVCLKLAADAATGVWCLGPGLEDTLLHRVSGEAGGPWSLLPRKKVRLLANPGGEPRQAFDSGQLGIPSLTGAGAGRLLAFLPNTIAVHEVDVRTGAHRAYALPFDMPGRSALSFAPAGERIVALLPLLKPGEQEQLTTQYALFQWNAGWGRVVSSRVWPRGVALVGGGAGGVQIWNRVARQIEFAALER
jgi:hypothetical protein